MRIIHVLRKPLSEGTVAANTLKHGTGGLNIDASRIGTTDSLGGGRLSGPTRMDQTCGGNEWDRPWMNDPSLREGYAKATAEKVAKAEKMGRWPANVILQHLDGCGGVCEPGCPVTRLDEQSGITTNTSHYSYKRSGGGFIDNIPDQTVNRHWRTETGGASRFYKQVGGSSEKP